MLGARLGHDVLKEGQYTSVAFGRRCHQADSAVDSERRRRVRQRVVQDLLRDA